jgi:hypothetical protein
MATGEFTAFNLGLYTNSVSLTRDTVLSDLVECTADWYTQQAWGGFGAAFLNLDNHAEIDGVAQTWVSTTSDPSATIYGYFVVWSPDPTFLVVVQEFDGAPLDLTTPGATLAVQPGLTFYSEFP